VRIAVFLSYGVSLQTWRDHGILDREVALYRALRDHEIALVVPDRSGTVEGLTVLANRWGVPRWLYSLVAPVIHRRYLAGCTVFRGHNGRALWTPLIAKWLSRRAHLVVRMGYIWSLDMIRRGVAPWKLLVILLAEWLACRAASRVIVTTPEQARYIETVHHVT